MLPCIIKPLLPITYLLLSEASAIEETLPSRINNPTPTMKELPFQDSNQDIQATDKENRDGFILFSRPITEPIYPTTIPRLYEKISKLDAFGTLSEPTLVNLAIYPLKELEAVRIYISDLSDGQNIIQSDDIEIRLVTYKNICYPNYYTPSTYRKMPELLEKITLNQAKKQEPQRYFIKIKARGNNIPGLYKGNIYISHKNIPEKVILPLRFKLLPFSLTKDPDKHYTAFNYDVFIGYKKKSYAWKLNAAKKDYLAMTEYGFDISPPLHLNYNKNKGEFYIDEADTVISEITKAGMKGPVLIYPGGDGGASLFYADFMKKAINPIYPEMPSNVFFEELTQKIKKLEKERKSKGWPEFIYLPQDEINPLAHEYGTKLCQAFKDAGVKIFLTKDPKAPDAKNYTKYVDFWCSQPFSLSYKEIIESGKSYWCYPNHNSYEIKDPLAMCRGGRMTYGFGLWRSGYTLLCPWIWRTYKSDYLGSGSSGGNKIAEDGSFIPAVYWECFREGIVDLKYIYTLEAAITRRGHSSDPKCENTINKAKALIQEIWDNIPVRTKYLGYNAWDPRDFEAYRWRIAKMILELIEYPETNNLKTPSVIANYMSPPKTQFSDDFFKEQEKTGNIEILSLDNYEKWGNTGKEGQISIENDDIHGKTLLFNVKIDHKTDGGEKGGNYPIGWPRIHMNFPSNGIDLTAYDYITLWIMTESDRNEIDDDSTPLHISFLSASNSGLIKIVDNIEERKWIPVIIPVENITRTANVKNIWNNVKGIQFCIRESEYKDKCNIKFYFRKISLIKFKNPVIYSIDMPSTLILPADTTDITVNIKGSHGKNDKKYILESSIIDKDGITTSNNASENLTDCTHLQLDTQLLKKGKYTIETKIKDCDGNTYSKVKKEILAENGPFAK